MLRLINEVRDYAWGSPTAIPELLGVPPTGEPVAELWMGAHPDEPSRWADDPAHPGLDELIASDPQRFLGSAVLSRFGPQLPFLLKVLAPDKCLSLQVHPNAEQAQAGYADEERRGVPRSAPERNYADPNHKPELLCALTAVDALCGFRPISETVRLFDALIAVGVIELAAYRDLLAAEDGLRATFTTMLTLPPEPRRALLNCVVAGCKKLDADGGEWASAAHASLLAAHDFPGDIGAVLALLLNHVSLAPGQAIYLGAGNVHAYLRGVGVEILANSDNVLRCGLTPKHIDVPELLRIADFTPLSEPYWQPREVDRHTRLFEVPVPDFRLRLLTLDGGADSVEVELDGPAILLNTSGAMTAAVGDEVVDLRRGASIFVTAGDDTVVRVSGAGTAFMATAGL
ncbi:mannose-6-phosphate isomerase, class I [Jatrophihabitans sp. DSM 45814]